MTELEDLGREVVAALRSACCHASKLLVESSSATALQLMALSSTDTILRSPAVGHVADQMPHLIDSLLPDSLDSIETGAFAATSAFLYQQIAQHGVLSSQSDYRTGDKF